MKPGPFKWSIYYTHVPLWCGSGENRSMVLDPLIYGWWGLDSWVDWEYRAVYETKEEAEKDVAWIVKSDPETWEGVVHVAPTLKLLGEEAVLSVIKAERERADREADEWGRRHDEKYNAEIERINRTLAEEAKGRAHKGKA